MNLDKLYAAVPQMNCREGCTDCCGPVPFTRTEWLRLPEWRRTIRMDCPYIEDGRCAVYDDRPFMCRLFGTADEKRLTCPHGCAPEALLTAEHAYKLKERYRKIGCTMPTLLRP